MFFGVCFKMVVFDSFSKVSTHLKNKHGYVIGMVVWNMYLLSNMAVLGYLS